MKNSLSDIVDNLMRIVVENEDCVFDLTGGDDLSLVAMGIVYERCTDRKLEIQQFNVRAGRVKDCDGDVRYNLNFKPFLTVEEYIMIHGGRGIYSEENEKGTNLWDFKEEFKLDIAAMWDVCKFDCSQWNVHTMVIGTIDNFKDLSDAPLLFKSKPTQGKYILHNQKSTVPFQ